MRRYLQICKENILDQTNYIQQNHLFQCDVFDQKVIEFKSNIERVERELICLLKIDLSCFEMFCDFLEAFYDELDTVADSFVSFSTYIKLSLISSLVYSCFLLLAKI